MLNLILLITHTSGEVHRLQSILLLRNFLCSKQEEEDHGAKTMVSCVDDGTLVPSRGETMDLGTLVHSIDPGTMLINSDTEDDSTMKRMYNMGHYYFCLKRSLNRLNNDL